MCLVTIWSSNRGKPINVWGWADAGESVKVTLGEVTASAQADGDGKWSVVLAKQVANAEPQTLTVKGKNEITLKDILGNKDGLPASPFRTDDW